MGRSVKRNGVLDILDSDEELQHPLKAQAKASCWSSSMASKVQIPVQAMVRGQSGRQGLMTMFPEAAPTQLPHPGHQEVHATDQLST